MKTTWLIITTLILTAYSNKFKADWQDLNTGINDHLTGVVFWGDNGVVSGKKGIYITNSGGNGSASWNRFNIYNSSSDSIIYNATQFNHCYTSYNRSNQAFLCGKDTIQNKAVILYFNLSDQSYSIVYYGPTGSSLNKITYRAYQNKFYAVGNNGLVIKFDENSVNTITSGLTMNLNSIAISSSNSFCIVADGYRIWGSDINSFSYTITSTPSENYKDAFFYDPYTVYKVGNEYQKVQYGFNYSTYYNYDYGPINGLSIITVNTHNYVGTDHGIFRSAGNNESILEWQPSSSSSWINHISKDFSSVNMHAAGNNGTLLFTNDYGGESEPYGLISGPDGGCVNSSISFTGSPGSASSCSWWLNGTYLGSYCNQVTLNYDSLGQQTLLYITSSSTYVDSTFKTFNIVPVPEINKSVVVDNSILCQKGSISITIDSTQENVNYTLINSSNGASFGTSQSGNGASITFVSDELTESGFYFLRAKSTLADCYADFTDTISITVEKTKAAYHAGNINLEKNKQTVFFENTTDAQNFSWTFSPNANIDSSNLANPANSFHTSGPSHVQLICWSNNGCYDTITGDGPFIYQPSVPEDSCWVNLNLGTDSPWSGFYYEDINQITQSKTGFYTCGYFNDIAIATQYGDSAFLSGQGGYMAKHSFNGTVQWIVQTKKNGSTNYSQREIIKSVVEDSKGNIYICGTTQGVVDYFYDNAGDSTRISPNYYIIKLDSLGSIIWNITSSYFRPYSLFLDKSDNLMVSANIYNTTNITLKKDGIYYDTVFTNGIISNFALVKFSSNGDVIWDMPIDINATNGEEITKVGIDKNNNVYISGKYEYGIKFYETSGTNYNEILGWFGSYAPSIYVVKLDSTGNYLWGIRSITLGQYNGATYPYDMVTDNNGNSYISGRNKCFHATYTHIFENSDSTTTSTNNGEYFIAKIDSNGVCNWIQANNRSDYGFGYNVSLHNGELSVLGQLSNNNSSVNEVTCDFTSANNAELNITISEEDYFIAVYDTSGNLLKLHVNGFNNNGYMTDEFTAPGLFRKANGAYIFARNGRHLGSNYENFGSTIEYTNGVDGYVTHFKESCAYTYLPRYNITDTVTVCTGSNYVFPDDTIIFNVSGPITHTSHLQAITGIDSIITTTLDTISSIYYYDTINICSGLSYTFPDGYIASNITSIITHNSVYINPQSCDSILTTTVIPINLISSFTDFVCKGDSYTFPDGFTQDSIIDTLIYSSTLIGTFGCDSIINTTIIPNDYVLDENILICEGEEYTFPDGTIMTNIIDSITHTSVFSSQYGCDSLINTHIGITLIDTSVSQTGIVLSSNSLVGTYNWLNCFDMSSISGESGQIFTPEVNGAYAVSISYNQCIDTSSCIVINSVQVSENLFESGIEIYPSPTKENFTISLNKIFENIQIIITDVNGKLVQDHRIKQTDKIELQLKEAAGIYFVHILSNKNKITFKINKIE